MTGLSPAVANPETEDVCAAAADVVVALVDAAKLAELGVLADVGAVWGVLDGCAVAVVEQAKTTGTRTATGSSTADRFRIGNMCSAPLSGVPARKLRPCRWGARTTAPLVAKRGEDR